MRCSGCNNAQRLTFLSALILVAMMLAGEAAAGPVPRGEIFPDLRGVDAISGADLALVDFAGQVVLVDFWSTRCTPCRREIPEIRRVYEKYRAQGFEVISISLDTDAAALREFIPRERMAWRHLHDRDRRIAPLLDVRTIPKAYVIGRDGRVLSDNARGRELVRAIEQGLAQPAPADLTDQQIAAEYARAELLRGAADYALAVEVYERVAARHAPRPTAIAAGRRAQEMRADPKLARHLPPRIESAPVPVGETAPTAEAIANLPPPQGVTPVDASEWLRLARESHKADRPHAARAFYERVIRSYPNTPAAREAEEELKKLPA